MTEREANPALKNRRSADVFLFRNQWLTIKQVAELTGMPNRTVRGRIRCDVVIDGVRPKGPPPKTYLFRGEYLTERQIMDRTGFGRNKVRARLHCGRFIAYGELGDSYRDIRANGHPLFFEGRSLALADWARIKGLKATTLTSRLAEGWTVKDALTRPVRQRRSPTPGGMSQLSATPRGPAGGHARTITKANEGRP